MDFYPFIAKHALPDTYIDIAQKWFAPLAETINKHQSGAKGPFFVGINGCQGSGKSTLTDFIVTYLTSEYGLDVAVISLDDFYSSKSHRRALAVKVHPLLETRGVPGTHDTDLAAETIAKLKGYGTVSLPRFDKITDNPKSVLEWPVANCPPDVVIIEGWCWGVPAQTTEELKTPVNAMERDQDELGIWRNYVNRQLEEAYQPLFDQMHYWVMLKPPSFENVYKWRCEQEYKLAQANEGKRLMSDEQIYSFIQHYQRLTEHSLAVMPDKVDYLLELDADRNIINVTNKAS